jgi:hypothetical protein
MPVDLRACSPGLFRRLGRKAIGLKGLKGEATDGFPSFGASLFLQAANDFHLHHEAVIAIPMGYIQAFQLFFRNHDPLAFLPYASAFTTLPDHN